MAISDRYGLPLPPKRIRLLGQRQSPLDSAKASVRLAKPKRTPYIPPKPPINVRRTPVLQNNKYVSPSTGRNWTNNPREILSIISRFARQNLMVIIRYKAQKYGGETVTRSVAPYALRFKNTKRGRRRYFYAEDSGDGNKTSGIHSFLLVNVVSVQGTQTPFNPKWDVEF